MANLKSARDAATAVWLSDGRLFVIGGKTADRSTLKWTNNVEMCVCPWNATSSTQPEWSLATPMPSALELPQACFFQDTIVVVGSGDEGTGTFCPCLTMDTRREGQWTAVQSLPVHGELKSLLSTGDELFAMSESFSTQFVIV